MRNKQTLKNKDDVEKQSNSVLIATSLLYIDEALYSERYEDCAALIKTAKRLGATQEDINDLLIVHSREFKLN